ncbi:M23 family metallopeptidase [Streptomyces sp. 8K308]|uniref:M23 family metallopeptidase n=1 Tax=Streptomyces sp. 8K308 TaxID=2530388 RepID=UPI001FB59E38|nr:M23 family metallopeptidase [Streptomyces sp. 8K308]
MRARLARRALGSATLGAVVLVGPWTVPATGNEPGQRAPQHPGEALPLAYAGPRWGVDRERSADLLLARGPASRPLPVFDGSRDEPPAAGGWTSPVTGFPMTARYAQPGGWAAGHHTGVDFATPVGTPVRGVGPGTVLVAEDSGSYGKHVVTRMADGRFVLYAHLAEIAVSAGQRAEGGTRIGDSGNTGNSTGPHLHFEVRKGRAYGTDVDPIAYLAAHGVAVDEQGGVSWTEPAAGSADAAPPG